MKIIVTGGAGFIGGNFVHHMVNKYPEYQIINLDLLTYAGNLETLKPVEDKPNYKFVHGDIADRDFVFKLFEEEKPDIVVNFASREPCRPFHHGPGGVCPYLMSWERPPCWMLAAPMELNVIIRYRPMRYTAICR